ncbi:MAG: S8/S53 family peptidase [Asgard group archaeon]|nr:S8/S53 family peptidase [Asgard group archaeon]
MNTVVSLLESAYDNNIYVDASVYMFIVGSDDPLPDKTLKTFQWIKKYNYAHPNSKFKVISCSFESTDNYASVIYKLARKQGCIIVAASGNYKSYYSHDPDAEEYGKEYVRNYPATYTEVFGAGGCYGMNVPQNYENYRMSAKYEDLGLDLGFGQYLYLGSDFYQDHGLSQATVDLVASAYKIATRADLSGGTAPESYEATGTSMAAPQVAVAAFLAARLRYIETNGNNPLDMWSFHACVQYSSENDPDADDLLHWDAVEKPIENLGQKPIYYSYRVGYGSLDVHDMMEYLISLS